MTDTLSNPSADSVAFNLEEIRMATQAKTFRPVAQQAAFSEFVYDSRKAKPNSIFVCIPGNRVDGHDFIAQATGLGATLVLGQESLKLKAAAKACPQVGFLVVEDTLKATQALAFQYRSKFSVPTIGVAGSSGKTTTKDLIGSILSKKGPTLCTEGSFNNHWGLPQTVLKFRRSHHAAVFEIGTNHFGEVHALTEICRPDFGLITTIGLEHLEFLQDEKGVLRANQELFDVMLEHSTRPCFLINRDHPLLRQVEAELKKLGKGRCLSFTRQKSGADVTLVSKRVLGWQQRFGWAFEMNTPWGTIKGELPLPGEHNLANALAATLATLSTETVGLQHVVEGLLAPKISQLRSELFKTSTGTLVYNDSYNANPTSFAALFDAGAALRKHAPVPFSHTIALVGDMLELGEGSAHFHREQGVNAALSGIETLLAVGHYAPDWKLGFERAKKSFQHVTTFPTQKELQHYLQTKLTLTDQTLVLIKGSRGSKMEETAHWLKKA